MSSSADAVTTAGRVQGEALDGVVVFRGVPYAAPPIGPNRFRPPQPLEAWDGVREALTLPPSCPQPSQRPPGWPQEHAQDEDCLHLNVWTPGVDDGRRPVMVWFHGGGYAIGSGSWPLYDGTNLARRGDVVVVTVNHRLGPLGYLHLDGLAGDRLTGDEASVSGNAGMLDLVAALEWVRDNAVAFGGDPGNVTIMGESGGGAKVATLLAMPTAAGLFHRATIQSGPALRVTKPERARAAAVELVDALGAADDPSRLWSASVEEILAASASTSAGRMGFSPVLDGTVIPAHPGDALVRGTANDVPVIVGCNRDESAGTLPAELAEEDLPDRLRSQAGVAEDHLDDVLTTYRAAHPGATPLDVLSFVLTDQRMRAGSIQLAEAKAKGTSTPVWQYFFTYALAGRAGHGYEIAFMFDNLGVGGTPPSAERQRLADAMCDAWIAFARTGDPNHDGLAEWPPFVPPERTTMIFGRGASAAVDDPDAATRELWERVAVARRASRR
ncbi:carboxylesterase/lipase family protein [Actinomarinicola tropica]|uniref:carboxylesterase/lipase family protein n=1 Tax=Actinomarinicola tropica TaxID=2789776 RepID=UPI0018972CF4|nr:carboxylesterase/lipase family protein [Actinomarinicola tropica]